MKSLFISQYETSYLYNSDFYFWHFYLVLIRWNKFYQQKVRFASPEEPPVPVQVKPPTSDVEVWTGEQEYDHFLYCRVYQPTKVEEQELKCIITLGEQIKKTKRIDAERVSTLCSLF